jgi:sulfate permease, SulP family
MAYAEVAGLPAVAGLWSVVRPLTLSAASTALVTATAVSVVAAGQRTSLANAAAVLAMAVGAICLLVPPRLGRPPRLSRRLAVSAGADRIHELMIVRQLGNLSSAPVDGGSVTHRMRSVVTHLQLVHPPTLAVGSAVLAMLFVIACVFRALRVH